MCSQKSGNAELTDNAIAAVSKDARWPVFLVSLILAVSTAVVYQGVAHSDFISFDDPFYVTNNYHVKKGLSVEGFRWAFTEFYASNWHPLTWLSHMLDVELFGLTPSGPHLVNLGFHIANTLLLFWFFLRTTKLLWPGAFVAAMFALHPLHVESVAWISERKDVLSTFFWFAVMISWSYYAASPSRGRYILSLLLFAFGLMSKPMLVTLPVVLLLLDFWPLSRIPLDQPRNRRRSSASPVFRLIIEKIPFAVLSVASAITTMRAQKLSINTTRTIDIPSMMTNAIVSYGRYALKMVWPAGLAMHYPHEHRPLWAGAAVVILLLIMATLAVIRLRRHCPYLLTDWFWYLVTLVPVAGFIQVGDQSHADRYTYIPLIGLFAVIAWGAYAIVEKKPRLKPVVTIAALLSLAAVCVLTWRQVGYWKDNVTLFNRTLAVTGDNPKVEVSLGSWLVKNGKVDEGIVLLEKAMRSRNHDGSAFNALGVIYLDKGDWNKALGYFNEAAKYDWMNVKAEHNLGAVYSSMMDYGKAVGHLEKAVSLSPYSAETWALYAVALCETGRIDEAIRAYERALELDEELAIVHYAKGHVLAKMGKLPEAVNAYVKSMELGPTYTTFGNLGNALYAMGRYEDAAQSYRRAIELQPERGDAYYSLGYTYARMGRKQEAIDTLKQCLDRNPNDKEARALYEKLLSEQ